MSEERKPLHRYRAPRYWPIWLGLGALRIVCLLPIPAGLAIGRGIGRVLYRLAGSRRRIARRNLELCFPELSSAAIDALEKAHFEALGMSLIEAGLGRWASDRRLVERTEIVGLENLNAALAQGRGVILLSAHFTTLELSGRALRLNCPPFDAVYRRNRSNFITEILRSGRERSAARTIEKREIKSMVRSLRAGRPVWYAPDQSYARKGAEIVEFFGVPSMHTTATSSLARLGNAVTLPYFPERLSGSRYRLNILPPLADFPSGDPVADTRAYVRVLEDQVRRCPEQYLWIHRKFKNLPAGYPDYYADLEASK